MVATIALQISIAAGLVTATPAPRISAPTVLRDTVWTDPSPHRARYVAVTKSVKLELLDWGGSGPPLVFLAGGGNTAHVYDDFATRFTHRFHVLGITRRGFGKASHPEAGYDTTTLVRDIVAVLDSLGLKQASFVAHSFGGSELNYLGVHYPKRVDRLVYLDSGMDTYAIFRSPEWKSGVLRAPQPPTPTYDDDMGSAWSWTLWADRLSGPGYPEAEVRATLKFDANDRFVGTTSVDAWLEKLDQAAEPVDLRRIRAPSTRPLGPGARRCSRPCSGSTPGCGQILARKWKAPGWSAFTAPATTYS